MIYSAANERESSCEIILDLELGIFKSECGEYSYSKKEMEEFSFLHRCIDISIRDFQEKLASAKEKYLTEMGFYVSWGQCGEKKFLIISW